MDRTSPFIEKFLDLKLAMPLGPGAPAAAGVRLLENVPLADIFAPHRVVHDEYAQACWAGLWLLANELDRSHRVSQDLPTQEGSFWHAIMHRREPDAWNSKYWWRRVGNHPVLRELADRAPTEGYAYSNPAAFVDFVENVRGTQSADEEIAVRVQYLEWRLLFDYCYQRAIS